MRCKSCNKDTDLKWNAKLKTWDDCPSCLSHTREFMNIFYEPKPMGIPQAKENKDG